VSDPRDPREDPERRPEPLIPSRAARHQAKRGRFLRGRSARPAPPPSRPGPEAPDGSAGGPPRRPAAPPPPDWRAGEAPPRPDTPPPDRAGPQGPPRPAAPPRPDQAGRQPPSRPDAPPEWARQPAARPEPESWEPTSLEPPATGPGPEPAGRAGERRDGRPTGAPGGRARRPARGRPSVRPPSVAAPALRGIAASSIGLAGALVAVAVVLVLAASALPAARPPATPATGDPYSARWVCPLLAGQATSVTVANVGGGAATLKTTVLATGKPESPAGKTLAAGATRQLQVKPQKDGYVQVEAFSAPVVVTAGGLGCASGSGNRWWLPASDTRQGIDTRVVVANPNNEPAVVDLVPHVTAGSIRPDEDELFVPPRSAVTRPLGDVATTGLKPSIEVVARAGRVVVGAAVSRRGTDEPALLPAQGVLRPAWWFAGGVSGGGRQAQVLVTNPNATPLQLTVEVTTGKGTFKPPGPFDEPIANGGTAELAIPPLDVEGAFAVRVRSRDGAAFAAALRVIEGGGDSAVSRIDLGTGQPERGWLLPRPPQGGQLVLANLSKGELEARIGDLAAGGRDAGEPVRLAPGKVVVRKVPGGMDNLIVEAAGTGLMAAPLGGGAVVPGSAVGGLPAGGPITPGPAAAP
jgi:Family of unknown function (DUF5719)